MPIQLINSGERMELVLREKPWRRLCMVKGCGNPQGKKSRICSRCLMLRWRANNPEIASFRHLQESAKRREISFELTFEEFRAWGHTHGYFTGKGRQKDDMTVDRIDQSGPYSLHNIQVLTNADNARKERFRQLDRDWMPPVCEDHPF